MLERHKWVLLLLAFWTLWGLPGRLEAQPRYLFQDLGSLGGLESVANGINASGLVVGWASTSSGQTRAFLKNPGQPMQDLGTLGGDNSEAYGINASGLVVGSAANASQEYRAFLWMNGTMHDLNELVVNPPPEEMLWRAWAINDHGWIVGETDHGRAFLLMLRPFTLPHLPLLLFE